MRGLAEFIMRGRWQALAVAVLGAGTLLFGWISAAAVALVTLRKGPDQGAWLVLWASLPAAAVAWFSGDAGAVALLLGTFALALVLRLSVSLALAVACSVVVGLLTGAALLAFNGAFLEQLVTLFGKVVEQLEAGLSIEGQDPVTLVRPTEGQVAGLLAAGNAAMAVVSLLLARWWQALLYNPGGFRSEFHALRLPQVWTLVLMVSAAGLWFAVPGFSGWAVVLAVPLTFSGFALVHTRAALLGRGSSWLTAFYALWFVVDPAKAVLLLVVAADAVVDFRERWRNRGPTPPSGPQG